MQHQQERDCLKFAQRDLSRKNEELKKVIELNAVFNNSKLAKEERRYLIIAA